MNSIYIHIPFCDSICSYCDFCKFIYNKDWLDKYLIALEQEIKTKYKGEQVSTIYIGGGTPSLLSLSELNKLFSIIKLFKLDETLEFTFECNIESLNLDKLNYLFKNGVNRLSVGVQTFNQKYLKLLNRHHTKNEVFSKIKLAKKIGFKNINIDLIYALPNETLFELENDLDTFLKLDITHISTYSLMIEPHTKLYIDNIENIDEELDFEMYNLICNKLQKNGFKHYEISNFAKSGYESKHNLVYWNNLEYYGFGVGASGYISNMRYDNTRNLFKYLKGEYVETIHELNFNETLENAFILGFRKIDGINLNEFLKRYKINVLTLAVIKKLIADNKLLLRDCNLYINPKYIYIQNKILIDLLEENYEREINCN